MASALLWGLVMNLLRPSMSVLVLFTLGCAPGVPLDPDGGPGCSPLRCDDGIDCTLDGCGAEGACTHTPVSDRCDLAAGEVCTPDLGCRAPAGCSADSECQDGDPCNGEEVCREGLCVSPRPLGCDDDDPCTTDTCEPNGMCAFRCAPLGGEAAAACGPRCPCSVGTWTLARRDRLPSSHGGILDFTTVTLDEDTTGPLARFASGQTLRPYGAEGTCPAFWFVGNLEGACTNQLSLRGTLDGPDQFTGTLNVLSGGGCDEAIIPFLATRLGATR